MQDQRLVLLGLLAMLAFLASGRTPSSAMSGPMPLNTNAAIDAGSDSRPELATDRSGLWIAVWDSNENLDGTAGTDYDILAARSLDNGASWTAPALLNTNAVTDLKDDFRPDVATDGLGNWVAIWRSDDGLGGTIGTDPDILVSRSTDGGATWTSPQPLNTNASSDSGVDNDPRLATDGAGNWVAVWLSSDSLGGTIGTDTDILVSRSTDGGATWTEPAPLNTDAATDSEFDQWADITTDSAGNWVTVWTSRDPVWLDFDLLVSRSTDNGATWSAPSPLDSSDGSGGNDSIPRVRTDGQGNWVTVWYSDDLVSLDIDIRVSRSTNNGLNWTAPGPLNANAATDSGHDLDPHVVADEQGNWVAVWSSDDSLGGTIGTDSDILISGSTDGGVSWTYPVPLNTNASADAGGDSLPKVLVDGAGNWLSVWSSSDSLNGMIGWDSDIVYTRCSPPLVDADADCISDIADNCPAVANADQADADGDGLGDDCDPCPEDPACDTDGDGWTDGSEAAFLRTDHMDDCADDVFDDAHPADFNNDTFFTAADLSILAAVIGVAVPPAPARNDIAPDPPDGSITSADLSKIAGPVGTSCAP